MKEEIFKNFFEKIDLEGATWRSATWHQLWNKADTPDCNDCQVTPQTDDLREIFNSGMAENGSIEGKPGLMGIDWNNSRIKMGF